MTVMSRPRVLAALIRAAGVALDTTHLAIGIVFITAAPPSIEALDAGSHASSIVWALMLIGGGGLSLAGMVARRHAVEAAGAVTVAAGFVVWGLAALAGDDVTRVTVGIAAVFGVCAVWSAARAVLVASRLLDLLWQHPTGRRR